MRQDCSKTRLSPSCPALFDQPVAYYAYILLRRWSEPLGLAGAGVIGSLTNTVLVLSALILFGLLTAAVIPVLTPVIVIEAVLSAVLTLAVVTAGAAGGDRRRRVVGIEKVTLAKASSLRKGLCNFQEARSFPEGDHIGYCVKPL